LDVALVSDKVAFHVNIGNKAKLGGILNSVSGQIAYLRNALLTAEESTPLAQVVNGSLPLIVHVDQADEIFAVVRLIRNEFPEIRATFLGGAEASLVASKIAGINASVVLSPIRSFPIKFETQRSRGLLTPSDLYSAGVQNVAIAIEEPDLVRDLRWEAGMARQIGGLSTYQAISSITKNVAQAFNLLGTGLGTIQPGYTANFVVFLGDPLAIESTVGIIALGENVECRPVQLTPPSLLKKK